MHPKWLKCNSTTCRWLEYQLQLMETWRISLLRLMWALTPPARYIYRTCMRSWQMRRKKGPAYFGQGFLLFAIAKHRPTSTDSSISSKHLNSGSPSLFSSSKLSQLLTTAVDTCIAGVLTAYQQHMYRCSVCREGTVERQLPAKHLFCVGDSIIESSVFFSVAKFHTGWPQKNPVQRVQRSFWGKKSQSHHILIMIYGHIWPNMAMLAMMALFSWFFVLLFCLTSSQIWLIPLVDDHKFNYLMKLKNETLIKSGIWEKPQVIGWCSMPSCHLSPTSIGICHVIWDASCATEVLSGWTFRRFLKFCYSLIILCVWWMHMGWCSITTSSGLWEGKHLIFHWNVLSSHIPTW